jgi:hypothetical protein
LVEDEDSEAEENHLGDRTQTDCGSAEIAVGEGEGAA